MYYSRYYDAEANSARRIRYDEAVEKLEPFFREGTNVWILLNSVLGILFSFAMKKLRGGDAEGGLTTEYVLNLICMAIEPQLAESRTAAVWQEWIGAEKVEQARPGVAWTYRELQEA